MSGYYGGPPQQGGYGGPPRMHRASYSKLEHLLTSVAAQQGYGQPPPGQHQQYGAPRELRHSQWLEAEYRD